MPSLLLIVLVLQVVIHLINTVGASTVNALVGLNLISQALSNADIKKAWTLYNRLPTSTATAAQNQRRLRRDFVRQQKEMAATSSQDEFARWAKLRRQQDKTQAELEKTSGCHVTVPHLSLLTTDSL